MKKKKNLCLKLKIKKTAEEADGTKAFEGKITWAKPDLRESVKRTVPEKLGDGTIVQYVTAQEFFKNTVLYLITTLAHIFVKTYLCFAEDGS
jgi:hypothetical protein